MKNEYPISNKEWWRMKEKVSACLLAVS